MAGETPILVQTFDNVHLDQPNPYSVLEIDVANSGAVVTAAKLPTAAPSECIGVTYDKAKVDTLGNVVKNSGLALRMQGIARVVAHSAITAGDFVSVASTAGDVATQAKATAGVVLVPIVGRALTSASALNDQILVYLMIGGRV